ncbi:Gfo/Idh/MocA family oxidoreductase [Rhodospirillaceae bacterium KN72]|uniref:Gfo/Idh/MocA family oxidoreductase n=1 Tax=Pacificispira spongiicola TaxID=2729598 RepID=A0A7Y0HDC8_9PROT|nr:Gfo/Idh/MocA family oxidoreductase [Pacificispira spongiicola]NMM43671.1 Gfo/Idh/MocA family oxidoreductase [Pacificispira spongiicola]
MANKIALVGIGKIARDQHVPAIAASTDWDLAATVSREGSVDGVPAYTDFSRMLDENPDIGTVSFCVPPAPRFTYASAAIAAGRNVMLEKPPGATLSECFALKDRAAEAGVSIFATWHSREAAQVDAAKAWLGTRKLRQLHITWKEDVRRWHPGQEWIWQPAGLGVFDPGINALSILTKILPDPIHLTAAVLSVPENVTMPVAAELRFSHPHGALISAEFDFLQEGEQTWTMEAETEEGTLVLSDGGAHLRIDGVDQPGDSSDGGPSDSGPSDGDPGDGNPLQGEYPRLYAQMAALVRNGESDMDLAPMAHVADAFLLGTRVSVEPFIE